MAFFCLWAACAGAATAQVRLGLEPIVLVGKHDEPGYNISGTVAGALAEFRARSGRLELKVEGVPAVSFSENHTVGHAGFPAVSAFNFDLRAYSKSGVFVGVGEAVYNQATPFYTPSEVEYTDSRVVGGRYSAGTEVPLRGGYFIESEFAVMPALQGVISYRQTPPLAPQGEHASNFESIVALGRRVKRTEYLIGMHGINFAANFNNGNAADRNVGYGAYLEARVVLGHSQPARARTESDSMTTMTAGRSDALAKLDWDHIQFYVGNAKQAAHYYCTAFGFELAGYMGPETGAHDFAAYLVTQNNIRFVLTSSLRPDTEISRWVERHGDGVRDVAIRVPNAAAAFEAAIAGGARSVREPALSSDQFGDLRQAAIASYGDVIHTFVERDGYRGLHGPGMVAAHGPKAAHAAGLRAVDHVVGNVGWNEMDAWADFYGNAFGFSQLVSFDDKDISTEFTALRSKVMSDAAHRVKFPINEPAEGRKKSQIEEYLDFNGGPGVQHIAIATDDIIATVRALRANGVEFLETPASYYDELKGRVGAIDETLDVLRELSILVDRDDLGYMLQIFTKPLQDRPTLFFEIIQRKGSLSFGKGNFKALFVAIENEQARRGTL